MNKKRVVYATDQGQLCPDCRQPINGCQCRQHAPAGDGIVRLQRQTKGRGGKPVTLITGLPLDGTALKTLAGELKRQCGVGGSIEDGHILIQGDKRPLLKTLLEKQGYVVKLAGG